MPTPSDEDLFATFRKQRDVDALATLFRRRVDELLRLAVFLAPRPTDAEDLVQATFLSAIARAETYRPGHRVMSWLCGILTNHARMLRRTEGRRAPEPAPPTAATTPVDAALQSELERALRDSIAALQEPYRSVLQLHLERGLNSQQIGAQLQQKPATVRKQMARAIEQLRTALPIGLATALVLRMSPAQLAERAAEAAQFVGHDADASRFDDDPIAAEPLAHGGALRPALVTVLVVAAVLATMLWWREDRHTQPPTAVAAAPQHNPAVRSVRPLLDQPAAETDAPRLRSRPGHALAVHVLDPDGVPHRGLEILCVADDGRPFQLRALAATTRRATTDDAGLVRFDGLPRGRFELAIAGAIPKAQLQMRGDDQRFTLQLPRRHRHRGYVTDPAGRPVPGALVMVSETSGRGDLPAVLATTDATGQYDAWFPLAQGRVFARHVQFAQSHCHRLAADRELHLELEPPVPPVAVHVTDEGDRPVAGALVALVPKSQDTDFYVPQLARTDALGRCSLPGPGPRHAAVLVQGRGFAASTTERSQDAREVHVQLRAPARLAGVARDASGAPLQGREVAVSIAGARTNEPTGPMLAQRVRTDHEGRFTLAEAPRGLLQVRIHGSCSGRLGPPMSQFVVAGVDVDTRDGDRLDVELRAPATARVHGTLRTPRGDAVAGWHLIAVPEVGTAAHRMLRRRVARSDADGRFELLALAAGERYQVGCYPPERWWPNPLTWPLAVATARAGSPCELVVDPDATTTATLRCQALRPDGRPARRATFELRLVGFQAPQTCVADAAGRARFGPLGAGDYWLVVGAPGLGSRTIPVHVDDANAPLDLGTVQLQRAARVAVRLVGDGKRSTHGLRVVAKNLVGDKFVAARSSSRGVAALRPLPPGRSQLLVYGHGIAPTLLERDLEPGVQWLDVDVRSATPVTLRFPFPLAENPFVINGPLHVRIYDHRDQLVLDDHLGATTSRGCFEMALGLAPGRYRVHARSIWNALAEQQLVVATAPLVRELPLGL
ncbi:MAG: sigma-70 family RNA polymerase sigma factor [Planctomycetota bacterium]